MNMQKKLGLVLGLLLAAGGLLFSFQRVLAATTPIFSSAKYIHVVDSYDLSVVFRDGKTIPFRASVDTPSADGGFVFKAVESEIYPGTAWFCANSVVGSSGDKGIVMHSKTLNASTGTIDVNWVHKDPALFGCSAPGNPPTNAHGTIQFTRPGSITITTPKNGTTVKDKVKISAKANVTPPYRLESIQIKIDGVNAGKATSANPRSITWDSSKSSDGEHTLTATLKTSIGSVNSNPIKVTVKSDVRPNLDSGATCEASLNNPLTWLMCPLFNIAADMTNHLIGLFEGQLCFKTNVSPTADTATCNGGITDTSSIKPAWSLIKNLISALLVIIMLIAIFAQATGAGFVDAYTIRKMLPKLVAAVILIQISYYLFSWIINLGDDLGEGLMGLLKAAFSSGTNVNINNLNQLLHHAGVGDSTAITVNWIAILSVGIAAAIALPTLLLLLFMGVVSLLVGLATLIFRKVLIIALLIISPAALLMWVLPNTERYWKLWWENFIKVLLMFPIIVLVVEAGRIFAYVAGPTSGGGLIGLFIVMVGFFGPLFLLPKSYKWGGQAMQLAGNGAFKASNALSERPKKYFQGRQQDWTEQRRRESAQRVANKEGFNRRRPWRFPLDQLRSGKLDPLKQTPGYRAVGERSVQAYIGAGEEVYQKDVGAAQAKILREGQAIRARGGDWDQYFQEIANGSESYKDSKLGTVELGKRSKLEKVAALKQIATLGAQTNWRYLESLHNRMTSPTSTMSDQEKVETRKFFDDNSQTILPRLPHIYTGVAAAADANPGGIGQMHGVEIESIMSNLSGTINNESKTPNERANAQRSLLTFLQNFQAAADNPNIQLENGGLRAVKAFLDSDQGAGFRRQINHDSPDPSKPGRDSRENRKIPVLPESHEVAFSPEARAQLDALKTVLADRINPETGTYSGSTRPGRPASAVGEVRIEHEPGTVITPDSPDFLPPNSSDLPK
jgi:hypothetical protein